MNSKSKGLRTNITIFLSLLIFLALPACTTNPIDTNDSSNPIAIVKAQGVNNQFEEASSINYGNNTSSYSKLLCLGEDPEGIKSLDFRVSDDTVSAAYCQGGAIYQGNFKVKSLFAPLTQVLQGNSSGNAATKLPFFVDFTGIKEVEHTINDKKCYPANNTYITLTCTAKNWSSQTQNVSSQKELRVYFKF